MRAFFLALAMFAAWPLCANEADEREACPLVVEFYEQVVILVPPPREDDGTIESLCATDWRPIWVLFVRGVGKEAKLIDRRILDNSMLIQGHEGNFSISWNDWSQIDRVIYFQSLGVWSGTLVEEDNAIPWFGQARPMVFLKEAGK